MLFSISSSPPLNRPLRNASQGPLCSIIGYDVDGYCLMIHELNKKLDRKFKKCFKKFVPTATCRVCSVRGVGETARIALSNVSRWYYARFLIMIS